MSLNKISEIRMLKLYITSKLLEKKFPKYFHTVIYIAECNTRNNKYRKLGTSPANKSIYNRASFS